MKSLSVAIALVVVVISLNGCASSETATRSQKTISSMDAVEEHLSQVYNQLDKTQSSLENVANSSPSELEGAYDSFREQVSIIGDMQEELNERIQEMEEDGDEYLSNWQSEAEEYSNPELRSDSRDRGDELRQTFNTVGENTTKLNQALEEYLSDVREIQSYLSNDLTQSGTQAIEDSRQQEQSAEQVRNAINRLQESISQAQSELGARQREG